MQSGFLLQVFYKCHFRCTIVKAIGCWKIVCRTKASGNVLALYLFILLSTTITQIILTEFLFIFLVQMWGAGLCGWNGPVSPLEVF
jgi:hypothetical protein